MPADSPNLISQIIGNTTAIVVAIATVVGVVITYRQYKKEPEEESTPEEPMPEPDPPAQLAEPPLPPLPINPPPPNLGSEWPSEIVVFDTKKQTTTLRRTIRGLECYLQDKRTGAPAAHQWTLGPKQLRQALLPGQITVDPNHKPTIGKFKMGTRREWLYSKRLFPDPEHFEKILRDYASVIVQGM
jgi:hypothetical protein